MGSTQVGLDKMQVAKVLPRCPDLLLQAMKNNSIIELKQTLEQRFDLVCFEDLANHYGQHGSIFNLFKQCFKEIFEPNQRLILYTSQPLDQKFLNHIQRAAQKVDISNWFILILTPFDLSPLLVLSNQLHGNDTQPMCHEIVNITDTLPFPAAGFFSDLDTVCPRPWTAVDISSGIDFVRPCCKFNGDVGRTQNNTIAEIFDSEALVSVRNQLSQGIKIPQCSTCWEAESYGTQSLRELAWHKLGEKFESDYFDHPKIKQLTVVPDNLCNFSCRICNYKLSSKIAAEEFSFAPSNEKDVFKYYIKNHTDRRILNSMIAALNNIETLHILGGEPFLWPLLPEFLSHAIDSGVAKNIQLHLNTNASIFPEKFIDSIQQFKSVEILLSIDDIGPRFELQRGGVWHDIDANIKRFVELKSSTIIVKLAPTVNVQNVLYLDDIVNFANYRNLEIVWWYLNDPTFLSIDHLTQAAKDLVYQKFHNHSNSELRAISNRVTATKPVDGSEFLNYMTKLDHRRRQNFAQNHKEIFDAMSS